MTMLKIVAIVVDKKKLIMYQSDGNTLEILQGDSRLKKYVDLCMPLSRGVKSVSIKLLPDPEIELAGEGVFESFEKKSKGFTRFFRVAKNSVAAFFGATPEGMVKPITMGQPVPNKQEEAVKEILSRATPANSDEFKKRTTSEDETIIAVKDNKIIPNMEKMKLQFQRANESNSPTAIKAFMDKMFNVVDERLHSVEDLLKFLERGDLPLSEDGSVIAYKILKINTDKNKAGTFVDCHSRNVPQSVGSFVCMDPSKVDSNRNSECSYGLHIARRAYIGNFYGDVVVMCKIEPKDFIAVPTGDANKVRVCGYHIIGLLDDTTYKQLKSNKPMTSEASIDMLSRAIKGDHVGIKETVTINGPRGSDITITQKDGKVVATKPTPKRKKVTKAKVLPVPDKNGKVGKTLDAPKVDPKKLDKKANKPLPMKQQISLRFKELQDPSLTKTARKALALRCIEMKRKTKSSWKVLGLLDADGKFIENASKGIFPAEPKKKTQPKKKAPVKKKAPIKKKAKPAPKAAKSLKKLAKGTNSELAKGMFKLKQWGQLESFRKQKKVGYLKLGFTDAEIKTIKENI